MRIDRVLAPNAGPFTGAGTNTWILDGDGPVAVIDPGPVDRSHESAIVDRIDGRHVAAVIVTHTHQDHAPLANPLATLLGVPAYGFAHGPEFDPDLRLTDDSVVTVGELSVKVVHTPGHSDDHLCFLAGGVLFTGDHIMGGSSVMVEDMGRYLHSLERVRRLRAQRLYPGHGEIMENPESVIDWYVAHRLERERQVVEAVMAGASSIAQIVESVYEEVDHRLHPLAARSVQAHLQKLVDDGVVSREGDTVSPIEASTR